MSKIEYQLNILNKLNDGENLNSSGIVTSKISAELQSIMLRLKSESMTDDGHGVNYGLLKTLPLFEEYKEKVKQLAKVDLRSMDNNERMAFFINIYNTLTIHGLINEETLPASILDIKNFWKKTSYDIGGFIFSLDDIEHGILRANRPHPSSTDAPFQSSDPRLQFSIGKFNPCIHFALVCGSKSCPAIQIYTSTNLISSLNSAARNFCRQSVKIDENTQIVTLSQLFRWYQKDFGESETEVLRWLVDFLTTEDSRRAKSLLEKSANGTQFTILYDQYDWTLNRI